MPDADIPTVGGPSRLIGRTVGRYVIERELQRADGWVHPFVARDPVLGRRVVVKFMPEDIREENRRLTEELLRAEASTQGEIPHPGIEVVLDAGVCPEVGFYFVTEFLESSMGSMIDSGFERTAFVSAVQTVAEAVGYAHRRGYVHRGIKPRAVRFSSMGNPKLGCFGLGGKVEALRGRTSFRRIGTPWYMAPERWTEGPASNAPQGDVWSLGILLYRGLTGRTPFRREVASSETVGAPGQEESVEIERQILHQPAPPLLDVPADLASVCLRCLEKDPALRYRDGAELSQALAALSTSKAPTIRAFVSHSSKDRELVEREIVAFLELNGVKTWYAKADIDTASRWERTILQGLESSDWFLLVMSPQAAASEWVKDEIHWAVTHRPDRVIPVLVGDCDPWSFHIRLGRIQHVDFRSELSTARSLLLERLRRPDPIDAGPA